MTYALQDILAGSSEPSDSLCELFFDKTAFLWLKKKLTMSVVGPVLETMAFS